MLSITPTSAEIITAVPTAVSIVALRGCRSDEKQKPLTAADIPFDMRPGPAYPQPAWKPKFKHVPTITHRVGDETFVVTGPIEPTVPHITKATELGWKKWFGDVAAAAASAKRASDEWISNKKRYFNDRRAKKDAEWEAKCARALEKGRPLPKRPKYREPPPDFMNYVKDEKLVAMVKWSRRDAAVAKRMREYKHKGAVPFGGRVYEDFDESFEHEDETVAPAIRSWLNIISLSLFNSAMGRSIDFGHDKEIEYSSYWEDVPRIFALDNSHVVLSKYRRCAFVVDLDGWWVSVEALRSHLRKLLPPHLMPNIITYRGAEDGRGGVENPHLVWILPPGSRVVYAAWKQQNPYTGIKWKQFLKQRKLHDMIQSGIVSHLIPLGADPGHTNVFKTKNPLASGYSIETCDDFFATMDDWRNYLPTITPNKREMLNRAKKYNAAKQGGIKVEQSNAIWNDGKSFRTLEIKAAQRRKDPAYLKAIKKNSTFVDWLYHPEHGVMTNRLINEHGDTPAVRSVLNAQRDFVLQMNMTPSEVGEFCNRGRDYFHNQEYLPDVGPMATAEERKALRDARKEEAGRRSRLYIKSVHCGLVAEEIESRMASAVPVVKAEVVKALVKAGTVSRSVAYDHYDGVLKTVLEAARYQEHVLFIISKQSCHQVEDVQVILQNPVNGGSGGGNESSLLQNPVKNPSLVWIPATTSRLNLPFLPIVDKNTLTECEESARMRVSWHMDVSSWRKSKQQICEDSDLVADPGFQAMVLGRSTWCHHRRH